MEEVFKVMVYWIWLNELKGLSLSKKKKLLGDFGSPKAIYESYSLDENENCFVNGKRCLTEANRIMEANEKYAIDVLTIDDAFERGLSSAFEDWPIVIYFKGALPMKKSVAVVGTRSLSAHGYYYTKEICAGLIRDDICINSGFSYGVESLAVDYTLKNKGSVAAFLPHGIESCYPKRNWKLMQKVAETQVLITPFSVDFPFHKQNFNIRNALMAMWSDEIILVEAPLKSGSLNTVMHGYANKKPIGTIKGLPDSSKCAGNMDLIKQKIAKKLDVRLKQDLNVLFSNALSMRLRASALSFDALKKLNIVDEKNLMEELLILEHFRIIEFKTNGLWTYNGW